MEDFGDRIGAEIVDWITRQLSDGLKRAIGSIGRAWANMPADFVKQMREAHPHAEEEATVDGRAQIAVVDLSEDAERAGISPDEAVAKFKEACAAQGIPSTGGMFERTGDDACAVRLSYDDSQLARLDAAYAAFKGEIGVAEKPSEDELSRDTQVYVLGFGQLAPEEREAFLDKAEQAVAQAIGDDAAKGALSASRGADGNLAGDLSLRYASEGDYPAVEALKGLCDEASGQGRELSCVGTAEPPASELEVTHDDAREDTTGLAQAFLDAGYPTPQVGLANVAGEDGARNPASWKVSYSFDKQALEASGKDMAGAEKLASEWHEKRLADRARARSPKHADEKSIDRIVERARKAERLGPREPRDRTQSKGRDGKRPSDGGKSASRGAR